MKNLITKLALGTALLGSSIGCGSPPIVNKVGDFTGDGINDVLLEAYSDGVRDNYLFIGNEDGSFTRAIGRGHKEEEYFKTKDGDVYFFNGEFYVKSQDNEVTQ